jgi:hypothetical protein
MIHTVYIDDTTTVGKRFMNENRRRRKGIEFANPAVTGVIPEGYMTGEEFERRVKAELTELYRNHGLI